MIKIYTDGACSGNPGPGGWGYVIIENGKLHSGNGSESQTTNNRMELTAAIKALEFHNDPILLFLSADHKIEDQTKFTNIIEEAIESADQGKLVTFGVPPTHTETGYLYIESSKPFKTIFIVSELFNRYHLQLPIIIRLIYFE